MRRFGIVCVAMLGVMGAVCPVGVAEDGAATQAGATQAATQAATTQGVEEDGKWRELMTRLEDGDFKVRDGAREELKRVGYEEQGRLRSLAAEAKSPEVRAALERRVEEITEQMASDPPPISLKVENATLGELAAALTGAMGTSVAPWPPDRAGGNRSERFTLKAEREPFWDVFCKLSEEHGLMVQSNQAMTLMIALPGLHKCVRAGGVAIFPYTIMRQAVSDLQAQENGASTLTLTCMVATDPRMKVTSYGGTKFVEVVDDAGNALHTEADGVPKFWRAERGSHGWTQQVGLSLADKPGKKITSVKGVVHLKVQVAEASEEVAEIDKNWKTPVTVGGRIVTFSAFDAQEGRITFTARVSGGAGVRRVINGPVRVVEERRMVTMTLQDATGKVLGEYVMEAGMGVNIGNTYTLPLKAKFSVATKTKELTVPFELKDLALPKF